MFQKISVATAKVDDLKVSAATGRPSTKMARRFASSRAQGARVRGKNPLFSGSSYELHVNPLSGKASDFVGQRINYRNEAAISLMPRLDFPGSNACPPQFSPGLQALVEEFDKVLATRRIQPPKMRENRLAVR